MKWHTATLENVNSENILILVDGSKTYNKFFSIHMHASCILCLVPVFPYSCFWITILYKNLEINMTNIPYLQISKTQENTLR